MLITRPRMDREPATRALVTCSPSVRKAGEVRCRGSVRQKKTNAQEDEIRSCTDELHGQFVNTTSTQKFAPAAAVMGKTGPAPY